MHLLLLLQCMVRSESEMIN